LKTKVLQFIGSFNQGGSERQAVALSRLLSGDGEFDVSMATLDLSGVLLDAVTELQIPPINEYRLTSFYNKNFVDQVRRCAKSLKADGIDIIHTHDFYTNVFAMVAATLAGTKVKIASKRETGGMRTKMQDIVESIAFGRADAIVVNSLAVKDRLDARGIAASKTELIYNGLDIERFKAVHARDVRDRYDILPEARVVTLVANLRHTVKNIPMLLRAAAKVTIKFPDTVFIIAGEGELESRLRSLAQELGVGKNIRFIGRVMNVPELLAASDICTLTSTAEGFSNSILEYMAAGKPVAATNVGGAAEAIIDGETGFLIESDNDEQLAAKLTELLANEEMTDRFGKKGQAIAAAKFSEAAQLAKTKDLYRRQLAAK